MCVEDLNEAILVAIQVGGHEKSKKVLMEVCTMIWDGLLGRKSRKNDH